MAEDPKLMAYGHRLIASLSELWSSISEGGPPGDGCQVLVKKVGRIAFMTLDSASLKVTRSGVALRLT